MVPRTFASLHVIFITSMLLCDRIRSLQPASPRNAFRCLCSHVRCYACGMKPCGNTCPRLVMLLVQGKFQQALKIMTVGSGTDVPQHIRDKEPHACIQLFCELANVKISYARAETDLRKRGALLLEASQTIDKARVIDPRDQMVHLSNAHLLFAQVCTGATRAVL